MCCLRSRSSSPAEVIVVKTRPAFVCAQAASLLTLTFQFYVEYVQKMICILINIEYFLEEKKQKTFD